MFIEFLSANLLPTLLFLIMFGMGMTLTVEDFKRITKSPSEVLIGLTSQIIVLPIIAFLISISLGLNPTQSVGLILLACCPGGATSNLFSHLAKADTALSITLTAFSSIITVFTVPFIINDASSVISGTSPIKTSPASLRFSSLKLESLSYKTSSTFILNGAE